MFRNVDLRLTGLLPLFFLLLGCGHTAQPDQVPTRGQLSDQDIMVPLDREIARYYVEDYPAEHPEGWHERLQSYDEIIGSGRMDQRFLADVAERYDSVDLAALMFMRHVFEDQTNREWQACLGRVSRDLRLGDRNNLPSLEPDANDWKVVFMPGWLYKDHAHTEADFSRTRRALDSIGFPYRFVETPQDGTVEENAQVLADVLREYDGRAQQLILVSASKSAAEVHWALGHLLEPEETEAVAAWINAGGVIGGTPLADHWSRFPRNLFARSVFLWKGWSFASLKSLRTEDSQARLEQARLPDHVLVVNYVAVPMGYQVSQAARNRYQLLSRQGPSDGLAPLWHSKMPGGVTLVELGADHYFLTVDISNRTLALTEMVLAWLASGQCPDAPANASDFVV
ncbi:hypothetical protein [Natronospira bacteriovora]|uniref:Uncharacterized protein n=1 Tax=Natronospira bacteriovora TaxID=3069753 RepID=A0ABU0W5Y8_9GAMM|nr:hypothetical protein [Natronospira sp. AB-CW4]MDQ2068875.1 hypothetical protein [Natronospira sp. AB-CW4]